MANLYDYIKKYGSKSFIDVPFNEIDNLILCSISYVDLKKYMPKKRFEKIKLKEVANLYLNNYSKRKHRFDLIAFDKGLKTLKAIRNTKRFRDIDIYNYVYKADENKQFCAMTLKLKDDLTYVLFEGTDHLISGWEEDFQMSYKFPIPAQKDAIRYLNRTITRFDTNIIVGGHSKGGNLALVSSMYALFFIKRRIIKIYNNDGPGILLKQFNSNKFKDISDKLVHIVPNYSIVGMLLNSTNIKVVKSPRITILAHDLTTWEINDNNLVETTLSSFSKKYYKYMKDLVENHTYFELRKYVKTLFDVLRKADITSLTEIKALKMNNVKKIIKGTYELDQETKDILLEICNFLLKNYSEDAKSKIDMEINKIKNKTKILNS